MHDRAYIYTRDNAFRIAKKVGVLSASHPEAVITAHKTYANVMLAARLT